MKTLRVILGGIPIPKRFLPILLSLLFVWSHPAKAQMSGYISSDQITGHYLDANDRSAVVLIHGWTGKDPQDAPVDKYAEVEDADWFHLVQALYTRLDGTGTRLILFHWEDDASTGPPLDHWSNLLGFFQVGFNNATTAAGNAFSNGDRLAAQLNQSAPDLRRVTFIAHSAGAWVAYRAVDKLLQANPYVVVNVVLLDPFIPGVDPTLSTPLTTATMGSLKKHASNDRIYRLENYFSFDMTDEDFDWGAGGGRNATSQIFPWRGSDINQRVDYQTSPGSPEVYGGPLPIDIFGLGHSGPKRFFADTVTAATQGATIPSGLVFAPWDFTTVGFYRGLVNEGFLLPSITTQPQASVTPVALGSTVTLSVSANRTDSFQWFKNGQSISGATASSYNFVASSTTAGKYVVRLKNERGVIFSEMAEVLVNDPAPAAPATLSAVAVSSSQINLTWSDTVNETGFKIERRLAPSGSWSQITTRSANVTSYSDTGLAADTAYSYQVRAYNAVGDSAYTAIASATTQSPSATCSDPNEPNDSSPTATPLVFGVAANGYVCTVTDVDWFRVDVAAPGVLTFDLTVPAVNDFDIELFGPNAAYIKGSYRDTGLAENIAHNATVTGTYWVRVYGYPVGNGSHNSTVSYTLTAGVVSGPVAILTPPQNRTVPVGASASFSVIASGAPLLAYQWQRDNVDIPGATGPTYATPVLALADSGAQFRVRVTNAFGSTFSTPATLTVYPANTITWTGSAGDGNWFNRTNWNPRTVPTASDVVQLNSVSLTVPGDAEFAVMNLAGGTLSGAFTNLGTMNWTAGTLQGQMFNAAGAVLNLIGGGNKDIQTGVLTNAGTVVWAGGDWRIGFGGGNPGGVVLNNLAGGLFTIQGDNNLSLSFNYYPWFLNAGTIRKTGGAGTTLFNSVGFTNTGSVEVLSGTLNFNSGFTSSGSVSVAAGATLGYLGGNFIYQPGATLAVAAGGSQNYQGGSFLFASGATVTAGTTNRITGNVTFSGSIDLPNLELAGGTLSGAFTNLGTMNWTAGTLQGQMFNAAGAVLNLIGGGNKDIQTGVLTNAGTVVWAGGDWRIGFGGGNPGGVVLNNLAGGLFTIQGDNNLSLSFNYYPWFLNAGTIRKTGGAGTTLFNSVGFTNTGSVEVLSGTLNFNSGFNQPAGETRLAGGSLSGSTFNFTGGTLSGSGTINASVVNGAVVSPGSSPGTLTINGNYTQTAAGALQIELAGLTPGNGFDRLVVNGLATLAGTLNVTLLNGFTPALSNAFSVLICGSRSGSFATLSLLALPNTLAFTVQYSPTVVTLLTTNSIPYNVITDFQRLTNGVFSFRFYGEPGTNYVVQASTNLVNWLPLATNQISGLGYLEFTDTSSTNYDRRFYRIAP